jgi:hypothetical protein
MPIARGASPDASYRDAQSDAASPGHVDAGGGSTSDASQITNMDSGPADPDARTAPLICDPTDQRFCVVATPEEGVDCPPTWDEAVAAFTCERLPYASDLFTITATCAGLPFLYASWSTNDLSVSCLYNPSTETLTGSQGWSACGAFCGGVNHVYWGERLSPCGFTDSHQEWCGFDYEDAGAAAN